MTITNDYNSQLIRAYTEPQYMEYLQDQYLWSNTTIKWIAWKALECGLRRIQRPSLTTKLCNKLLPTATTLKKWKYQHHDHCPLCQEPETHEHIFRCTHHTRTKWRRTMIKTIHNTFQRLHTKSSRSDTFCTATKEWLDTGVVDLTKYTPTHQDALVLTQARIGWRHIFLGLISQGWEQLQGHTTTRQGISRPPYLWAAAVVETLLRQSIALWEQRNKDVHGHDTQQQQRRLQLRHQQTIKTLLSLLEKCLPRHQDVFPTNPADLLDAPTPTLESWILTRKSFILNSVKQAHQEYPQTTQYYIGYIHLQNPGSNSYKIGRGIAFCLTLIQRRKGIGTRQSRTRSQII